MVNQLKKTQNTGKVNRRWLKKVNIKSFFKFIVIQVIILCKKFMHIKQIRIRHSSDQFGCHSFRRVLNMLMLYK